MIEILPTYGADDLRTMTIEHARKMGVQRYRDGFTFAAYNVRPPGFTVAAIMASRQELIAALDHGWHTAHLAEPVKLSDGRIIGNSDHAAELERICEA